MKIAATITQPYVNGRWNLNKKCHMARVSGIDIVEEKLGQYEKLIKEKEGVCYDIVNRLVPKRKHIPIIITGYRPSEGDKTFDRYSYLEIEQLLELGVADYVDIELLTTPRKYLNDVVKLVKKFDKEIIISWHDYEKTPEKEFLEKVYEKEVRLGADIPKMCPTATDFADTVRVVEFVKKKSENGEALIWPMGEEGKLGRILTLPLIPWGFARFDGSSAPGQPSLKEMNFWRLLFENNPNTHKQMMLCFLNY